MVAQRPRTAGSVARDSASSAASELRSSGLAGFGNDRVNLLATLAGALATLALLVAS
jgi:hypothetical protein